MRTCTTHSSSISEDVDRGRVPPSRRRLGSARLCEHMGLAPNRSRQWPRSAGPRNLSNGSSQLWSSQSDEMHVSGSDLSHQRSRRVALAERPNWEGCPDKRSDADPRAPIPGPGQAQVMTLSVLLGTAQPLRIASTRCWGFEYWSRILIRAVKADVDLRQFSSDCDLHLLDGRPQRNHVPFQGFLDRWSNQSLSGGDRPRSTSPER